MKMLISFGEKSRVARIVLLAVRVLSYTTNESSFNNFLIAFN